ncbi:YL1-domain-containing protein, partial [Jaminaea rosea]
MASSSPPPGGVDDGGDHGIETVQALALGRSKRSTAGNRMRALLDKQTDLDDDDMFREEADDDEFAAVKEVQEDIFDSDFGDSSEDEGAAANGDDDEEAGERQLEEEAQQKQRAAAKKRQAANRMAPSVIRRPKPTKTGDTAPSKSKRISFAPEASPFDGSSSNRRVSSRRATVQSALDTQSRLEEAEARRLQHPMVRNPPKQNQKPSLTQDELIHLALDREEENRKSLKEYYEGEEERKRAEMARDKSELPSSWLRWRSVRAVRAKTPPIAAAAVNGRAGQGEAAVPEEASPLVQVMDDVATGAKEQTQSSVRQGEDESLSVKETAQVQAEVQASTGADESLATAATAESDQSFETPPPRDLADGDQSMSNTRAEPNEADGKPTPQKAQHNPPIAQEPYDSLAQQANHDTSVQEHRASSSQPQRPVDVTLDPVLEARKVAAAHTTATSAPQSVAPTSPSRLESRNIVSLHFAHRPSNNIEGRLEQLNALFGNHVDWTSAPIVSHRNRPMRPRASLCAITGKTARYMDAKTGIPFADVRAAKVLRRLQGLDQHAEGEGWEWMELTTVPGAGGQSEDRERSQSVVQSEDQPAEPVKKKGGRKSGRGAANGRPEGFLTGFWSDSYPRSTGSTAAGSGSATATAGSSITPGLGRSISTSSSSAISSGPRKRKSAFYYDYSGIAPGDEKAIMERALALPEGTTRSGRARGVASG